MFVPVALTAIGCAAALAVARLDARWPYALAKLGAAAGFVWLALAVGAREWLPGSLLLAGLTASAAGDVALAWHGRPAFVAGMAAFAVAHVSYGAACVAAGVAPAWLAISAITVAGVSLVAWRYLRPHVPPGLRVPLAGYVVLVSAMAAVAWAAFGRGAPLALAAGATGFYLSDLAVARERFVTRSFADKLWGLPLYYAAQLLIALAAAS